MNVIKIQAELSEKEYKQLQRLRELQTPYFEQIEELEPKFHFILLGKGEDKRAIMTVGNWKQVLEKHVRELCPWGLDKIQPAIYTYTICTKSKILFDGYTICYALSNTTHKEPDRQEAAFDVREYRMKPIKEPKINSIITEDL